MSSSRSRKFSNPGNNASFTVLIGEITSPVGLHGEVRVYPHTDFPERFREFAVIGLQRDQEPVQAVNVQAARVTGQRIVVKLENIDTIDQADALRGARLYIPETWMVELGEDEYFHHQLLGLEVVTTRGDILGKITHILQTGANDVYETPLALIPATKDMIREIDLAQGRMVVDDRPGLRKTDSGD